jgi:hypothetical protein
MASAQNRRKGVGWHYIHFGGFIARLRAAIAENPAKLFFRPAQLTKLG